MCNITHMKDIRISNMYPDIESLIIDDFNVRVLLKSYRKH